MARLLLMRHAEAQPGPEQDEPGRFSTADTPLSKRGRRQAERVGQRLAEDAVRVDAVYASSAVRCRETAELVAEALDGEREVRVREDLLEIPYAEPGADYATIMARIVEAARALREDPDPTLATGTSWREATERFAEALEAIQAEHERPLVVAHGAQNRAWLTELLGMPPHRLFSLAQDHACVNAIRWEDGRPVLEALNATPGSLAGGPPGDEA